MLHGFLDKHFKPHPELRRMKTTFTAEVAEELFEQITQQDSLLIARLKSRRLIWQALERIGLDALPGKLAFAHDIVESFYGLREGPQIENPDEPAPEGSWKAALDLIAFNKPLHEAASEGRLTIRQYVDGIGRFKTHRAYIRWAVPNFTQLLELGYLIKNTADDGTETYGYSALGKNYVNAVLSIPFSHAEAFALDSSDEILYVATENEKTGGRIQAVSARTGRPFSFEPANPGIQGVIYNVQRCNLIAFAQEAERSVIHLIGLKDGTHQIQPLPASALASTLDRTGEELFFLTKPVGPDKNTLWKLGLRTGKTTAMGALPGASVIALDPTLNQLFIGLSVNPELSHVVTIDLETGEIKRAVFSARSIVSLAFDPNDRILFVVRTETEGGKSVVSLKLSLSGEVLEEGMFITSARHVRQIVVDARTQTLLYLARFYDGLSTIDAFSAVTRRPAALPPRLPVDAVSTEASQPQALLPQSIPSISRLAELVKPRVNGVIDLDIIVYEKNPQDISIYRPLLSISVATRNTPELLMRSHVDFILGRLDDNDSHVRTLMLQILNVISAVRPGLLNVSDMDALQRFSINRGVKEKDQSA